MKTAPRVVAGVGAAILVVTLSACSSSSKKKSSSTSSSSTSNSASSPSTSAATTDYSTLLISASDIPIAGFTKGTPAPPPQGKGTTVTFTDAANKRTLGDNIIVFDSASAATTAAQSSVNAAKQQITSPVVTDAPIGGGGTAIRGTTSDGAVAILIFTEGRAVVVLEFDSAASDPVPTEVIQQVATKQDELVKSGVPQ